MTGKAQGKTPSFLRDFGLSFGVASTAVGLGIVLLTDRYPWILWRDDATAASALVAAVAISATILSAAVLRRQHLVFEIIAATVVTGLFYTGLQAVAVQSETASYGASQREASIWPVQTNQDYSHPSWKPAGPYRSSFGVGTTVLDHGQFVVSIDASRDFTYLVAPGVPQRKVHDFLYTADMTYRQGPEDGWCMMIFGFERSEHWFGMKIGPDRYELTRDTGGLPHHPLDGPKLLPQLRQGQKVHVAVFKHGSRVRTYVGDRLVGDLSLEIPDGLIWLGAQAANSPDLVRCAVDNVVMRGTGSRS